MARGKGEVDPMDLRIERDPNGSEPCFYVIYNEDIVGTVYLKVMRLSTTALRSPRDGSWSSPIMSSTSRSQDAFSHKSRLR